MPRKRSIALPTNRRSVETLMFAIACTLSGMPPSEYAPCTAIGTEISDTSISCDASRRRDPHRRGHRTRRGSRPCGRPAVLCLRPEKIRISFGRQIRSRYRYKMSQHEQDGDASRDASQDLRRNLVHTNLRLDTHERAHTQAPARLRRGPHDQHRPDPRRTVPTLHLALGDEQRPALAFCDRPGPARPSAARHRPRRGSPRSPRSDP